MGWPSQLTRFWIGVSLYRLCGRISRKIWLFTLASWGQIFLPNRQVLIQIKSFLTRMNPDSTWIQSFNLRIFKIGWKLAVFHWWVPRSKRSNLLNFLAFKFVRCWYFSRRKWMQIDKLVFISFVWTQFSLSDACSHSRTYEPVSNNFLSFDAGYFFPIFFLFYGWISAVLVFFAIFLLMIYNGIKRSETV